MFSKQSELKDIEKKLQTKNETLAFLNEQIKSFEIITTGLEEKLKSQETTIQSFQVNFKKVVKNSIY